MQTSLPLAALLVIVSPALAQDDPAPSAVPLVDADLLTYVEGLTEQKGYTPFPIAQLTRGERVVLVYCPGFDAEGRWKSDHPFGFTFTRTPAGLQPVSDSGWRVTRTMGRVVQELGGDDYELRPRDEGLPADALASRFVELFLAFRAACPQDPAEARRVAIAFSRLFSLEAALFDDLVGEPLSKSTEGRLDQATLDAQVDTERGVLAVRISLPGKEPKTEEIRVERLPDSERWVISGGQ